MFELIVIVSSAMKKTKDVFSDEKEKDKMDQLYWDFQSSSNLMYSKRALRIIGNSMKFQLYSIILFYS